MLPTIENTCGRAGGYCSQIVWADGKVNPGDPPGPSHQRAGRPAGRQPGHRAELLFTTHVGGISVREIVYPLAGLYRYSNGTLPLTQLTMENGGALQLTAPLTGVHDGLHHLAVALWLIILIGVGFAVLLGLGVGRAVLRPLDDLTDSVEELARTTDVSQRLDPGGPDELGRLRRAFNRLFVALDSSRESQRQLVLDASHELRTPLTSLRTNMEVVRQVDRLSPEDRDVLVSDVLTQLDELTSLVADMAELARGDMPQVTKEMLRFDELVAAAVEAATTHGRSRGVSFVTSLSPNWISGSAARVERAVNNLLDNAVKYSPDGAVVEVACGDGRAHRAGPRARRRRRRHRPHLRPLLPGRRGTQPTRFGPRPRHRGPGGRGRGGPGQRAPRPRWRGPLPTGLPPRDRPPPLGSPASGLTRARPRGAGPPCVPGRPLASNALVD